MTANDQIGCLAIIARLFKSPNKQQKRSVAEEDDEFPYVSKKQLMTDAEREFLVVLKTAIPDGYEIMVQVRLADVIENNGARKYFNKINAKHLDFVVCKERTLEIVFALELDDKSHDKPKRRIRDEFLNNAMKAAGVPLVRIKNQQRYDVKELQTKIRTQTTKVSKNKR